MKFSIISSAIDLLLLRKCPNGHGHVGDFKDCCKTCGSNGVEYSSVQFIIGVILLALPIVTVTLAISGVILLIRSLLWL